MELEKPDLCALAEDGRTLRLRASRCARCEALSFPMAIYGCPVCGAPEEAQREEGLSGRARLLEFIAIHGRIAPGLKPPVVVGEAEIAPGVIQEIEMGVSEDALALDMTVQAVAIPVDREGGEKLAIRFVPVPAEPGANEEAA